MNRNNGDTAFTNAAGAETQSGPWPAFTISINLVPSVNISKDNIYTSTARYIVIFRHCLTIVSVSVSYKG